MDIAVKDGADAVNRDAIRSHLPHIAQMFSDGNFDAPMLIHQAEVPGTARMAASRAESGLFTSKHHEEGGSTSSRPMPERSPRCTRSCDFRSPTTARATRPPSRNDDRSNDAPSPRLRGTSAEPARAGGISRNQHGHAAPLRAARRAAATATDARRLPAISGLGRGARRTGPARAGRSAFRSRISPACSRERDQGRAPCRKVRAIVADRLSRIDDELAALTALKAELTALLCNWDAMLARTPPETPARLLDALTLDNGRAGCTRK